VLLAQLGNSHAQKNTAKNQITNSFRFFWFGLATQLAAALPKLIDFNQKLKDALHLLDYKIVTVRALP
jgi:hypothetical protein